MHIATSAIQCCWQLQPDGARKVQPLQCVPCNAALTLAHLAACAEHAVFRDAQRRAMLAVLATEASAVNWVTAHQHMPLEQLLAQLVPPSPGTPPHLHITHAMCGVVSVRQANAACKLLGVARATARRALMQQLRLCCTDGIQAFYAALKLARS
jgi:hypothetical protein